VQRFNAVDGNDLDLSEELKSHSGTYGCLHSHAAVYKEAIRIGASHVLVLEDDCVFSHNIRTLTAYLAATLDKFSWIHLGGNRFHHKHAIAYPTHLQVSNILDTHGYVADRALMVSYINWLTDTPFPRSGLLHADRLLRHICRLNSLKICIPPKPLAWQDKSLTSDVQWGVPHSP
jgi:hypothetical protein